MFRIIGTQGWRLQLGLIQGWQVPWERKCIILLPLRIWSSPVMCLGGQPVSRGTDAPEEGVPSLSAPEPHPPYL